MKIAIQMNNGNPLLLGKVNGSILHIHVRIIATHFGQNKKNPFPFFMANKMQESFDGFCVYINYTANHIIFF